MSCLTSARASFHDLMTLSDEELAKYDIAEVNLACASGLPGTEKIDVPASLRLLDRWAEQVYDKTQRCRWFLERPEKYNYSFNLFRIHVMISVLQRDFGVHYNPRCIPEDSIFQTEDSFIHGILQGTGGTCASLPVLYTAVGRRLNYPLKLVLSPGHLLFRWDDSNGERFNIAASNNNGFDNPDDDHYRYHVKGFEMTLRQEKEGYFLISLSPRQELACFLGTRAFRWLDLGNYQEAVESFIWASSLNLENKLAGFCTVTIMDKWHQHLQDSLPPNFPKLDIKLPPRRFANVPHWVEAQAIGLETMEKVLQEPEHQTWWEMLRQSPHSRPLEVPSCINIQLYQ
jgi:hypothetical protein